MMNVPNEISIRFADEFENNLYTLSKRYRSIRADVQPVIEQIQAGNFIGDRIPNLGEIYVVFKIRVKNSNIQKGKSAGYRLIYQVESPTRVLLLTIYSKSDRTDISANKLFSILAEVSESE